MLVRKLHRWFGLALSLFLLVIGITGVLLIWKPEYIAQTVPTANAPLVSNIEALARAIDVVIAAYPEHQIRLIQIQPDGLALFKVFLSDTRYAWHDQAGVQLQLWSSNGRLEDWLLDLHHRFLLGNTIGLNIAGFSGILLVPLVLIGACLWWPSRKAAKFVIWPRSLRPGYLIRSHRNLGVLALAPMLLLAVTGVILVYPAESATVLLDPQELAAKPFVYTPQDVSYQESTAAKFRYATATFPQATLRWVRPPTEFSDQFMVGLQAADSINRVGKSHVAFERHRPVEILQASAQSGAKRLFDFMLPLHTGKLPLWYRLLLTLFGLMLIAVVCLGVLTWCKKRQP